MEISKKINHLFGIKKEIDLKIEKLKSSGTIIPNAKIYEDFNSFARNLQLEVAFSIFKDKEISHAGISISNNKSDKISTISIMLKTTQNLLDNKIETSNWDNEYIHTQSLINHWYFLLKKYEYEKKYKTIPMLILIYSLEDFILTQLLYLCKNEIQKWIEKEEIIPAPKHIFCSSAPSYNIIFENQRDLDLFYSNYNKIVYNKINFILVSNDKYRCYNHSKLTINYLHKKMRNINLYGLSRED